MSKTRREQFQPTSSYQINRDDLSVMARHYQKKYGVKIIIDRDQQANILRAVKREKTKPDNDIADYFKRRWQYLSPAEYPYPPRFDPSWKKHEKELLKELDFRTYIENSEVSNLSPQEYTNHLNNLVVKLGLQKEVEAELKNGKYQNINEYVDYLQNDLKPKLEYNPVINYPALEDPFAYYAPTIKAELAQHGYLNQNGTIRELSEAEHQQLEIILEQITDKLGITKQVKEYMQRFKQEAQIWKASPLSNENRIEQQAKNYQTQKENIEAEVKAIQNSLKEGEAVGYASTFSMSPTSKEGHVEFLIITKDKIIKPVEWNITQYNSISNADIPGLYSASFNATSPLQILGKEFIDVEKNAEGKLVPQTGEVECGTLGMLYLKDLLRDNGEQLKNSLAMTLYTSSEQGVIPVNLFVPSPEVLRYSQSNLYNQILNSMMQSSASHITVEYKGVAHDAKTVEQMLKDSIQLATQMGREDVAAENKKILEQLPAIRERWTKEYQTASASRDQMNLSKDEKVANRMLEYKTKRFEELTTPEREAAAKAEVEKIAELKASSPRITAPGASKFAKKDTSTENEESPDRPKFR